MSDYLARLIARSTGAEAVVRPLLTPHYAVREEIEFPPAALAVTERGADADERRSLGESDRTLEGVPATRTSDQLSGSKAPTAATRAESPRAESPRAESPRTNLELPARERTPAAQPTAASRQEPFGRHNFRSSEQPAGQAPTGASDAHPDAAAPVGRAAARNASTPPEPGPEPNGGEPSPLVGGVDTAPVIRISIGRIEVRANPPRSTGVSNVQAARPAQRLSVAPKLTLEEYLRRDEARR